MADLEVKSEITGTVWKIISKEGDEVQEDDTMMILESMKMEIPLSAPEDGTIRRIVVSEGDAIAEGDLVAVLEV